MGAAGSGRCDRDRCLSESQEARAGRATRCLRPAHPQPGHHRPAPAQLHHHHPSTSSSPSPRCRSCVRRRRPASTAACARTTSGRRMLACACMQPRSRTSREVTPLRHASTPTSQSHWGHRCPAALPVTDCTVRAVSDTGSTGTSCRTNRRRLRRPLRWLAMSWRVRGSVLLHVLPGVPCTPGAHASVLSTMVCRLYHCMLCRGLVLLVAEARMLSTCG